MSFVVKSLSFDDINEKVVNDWRDLELRSFERNAYLSPDFVIPEIKYLPHSNNLLMIVIVETDDNEEVLMGLGIFQIMSPSINFPFPYLEAYKSAYSYLSGLLLDATKFKKLAKCFLDYFNRHRWKWYGVRFVHTTFLDILNSEKFYNENINKLVFIEDIQKRACIIINDKFRSNTFKGISNKLQKQMRSNVKKLSKYGDLTWHILYANDVTDESINTFLKLEHQGWKGKSGTSLLSAQHYEDFFIAMIKNFKKRGDVFFTELRLGEEIIASTCNIMSFNNVFAFKIGWDDTYAKYSPGKLNEYEFLRSINDLNINMEFIDSGAVEGSFIEKFWPDRITLSTGFYITNKFTRLFFNLYSFLRKIKRKIGI